MRFVFQYPETSGIDGDLLDAGPVAEVAAAAESAGWDGLAFTEHPAPSARWLEHGGHQALDPFVALACAAGATNRLRLLTYLAVAPYRNPLLLAKTAASLDKVSGGRLTLGLGAGYLKSEFRALGATFDDRNDRFDEALDVLSLHWSGEPFSYQGRDFEARDVQARPRPVQQPIPIWIGGNARRARERVATNAQGWMPLIGPPSISATVRTRSLSSLDDVASAIADIAERRAETDRAREPFDVLYPYFDAAIADPSAESDRHREAFARLAGIGITQVAIPGTTRDPSATYEFLAAFGEVYDLNGRGR